MERVGDFWSFFPSFHKILQLNHIPLQSFKLEAFLTSGKRRFLVCNASKNEMCLRDYVLFFFSEYRPSSIKHRERKPDTACAVPFLSINRRTSFPALKSKHLSRTSHQQANYTLCNTAISVSFVLVCLQVREISACAV